MKGTVLVVENDEPNRLMIAKALNRDGFDSVEADGYESALDLLKTKDFDVLLTDKNMPVEGVGPEGGLELIRWVRLNKPHMPIILITGYPTVDSAIDALKVGAFDYLIKPFNIKTLLKKLDQVCEYRKSVNPEAVMHAYLSLNRKLLEAAQGNPISDTWLTQVQDRLNRVFQVFRAAERTLLEHRQRLAEIQVCAEGAMEDLPRDNPLYETLKQIAQLAAHRI
jgi:DNA-binding NtrC family response regulator